MQVIEVQLKKLKRFVTKKKITFYVTNHSNIFRRRLKDTRVIFSEENHLTEFFGVYSLQEENHFQ